MYNICACHLFLILKKRCHKFETTLQFFKLIRFIYIFVCFYQCHLDWLRICIMIILVKSIKFYLLLPYDDILRKKYSISFTATDLNKNVYLFSVTVKSTCLRWQVKNKLFSGKTLSDLLTVCYNTYFRIRKKWLFTGVYSRNADKRGVNWCDLSTERLPLLHAGCSQRYIQLNTPVWWLKTEKKLSLLEFYEIQKSEQW